MNALIPISTDPVRRTRRALLVGGEYWSTRDLMTAMDRDNWDAFAAFASKLPSAKFVREHRMVHGVVDGGKPDYRIDRADAERVALAFRSPALVAA